MIGTSETPIIIVGNKRDLQRGRVIPRWKGTPRGREGQALTWVAPERLARYSMPSADVPVVGALRQPDRYLVTPEPGDEPAAWRDSLARALADGIERVQLRARSLAPAAYTALARAVAEDCRKAGAGLLLNRDIALARYELAIQSGFREAADGRFTLIETECLGSCADAPICLINDKRVESFMDNAKLDALIDELRNKERH